AIEVEPMRLGHVAQAVVEMEARRLSTHVLEIELEPNIPLVLGEEVHVGQVIRNFLSNAVKYSAAGGRIRTVVAGASDGATLTVLDDGPGFGSEDPQRLFELFFRTSEATKVTSGAGIGLFVSRELVTAMGGRIWAKARPGEGAEFGFWLPGIDEAADD
ncbi:MAG: ATP-binding protein, partial [Chloroflexota bacterium]